MTTRRRLLVLGRSPDIMERVRALLSDLEVVPTFTDDDAKRALESQTFDAFLIGGGVEPASREALVPLARARGLKVIEHFGGPAGLRRHVDEVLGA